MPGKGRTRNRAARLRAEQQRRDRRRRNLLFGSVTVAAVLIVSGLTWAAMRSKSSADAESAAPIDGVQTFTGLARDHVAGSVVCDQQPPVGGKHAAQWQNCGWYAAAIASEAAVQLMEHGAVWITYRPDLQASAQKPSRTS